MNVEVAAADELPQEGGGRDQPLADGVEHREQRIQTLHLGLQVLGMTDHK